MSSGRGCSSDLVGIPIRVAGMIDGKLFERSGCAKVVGHPEVCRANCCCSTEADKFCFLEYSEWNKR